MSKVTQIDGLPVIDAKRPLVLHITKGDIAKATTKAPNACAVARACARELHVKEVRIHLSRAYLRTNNENWVRYHVPHSLRDEIVAFDRGGAFEPGEFDLGETFSIKLYQAKVRRERSAKSTTTRAGKKRRKPNVLQNVRGGPA